MESPKAFGNADIKTRPVGSGPYELDVAKTVVGSSYVFTKNPDYWAPDSVKYDGLVLNVYSDPTSLLNAIKGGQLSASNTADNNALDQMTAAGYKVNAQEFNWTGLILFDRAGVTNPALGDVRVRQAINYAFDTKALLKTVGKGYGSVTSQVFGPNTPGYDKSLDSEYSYDPAKAKALLAEAGYGSGLTLSQPSSALLGTTTYALIAQQLKDVGITVNYTDTGNNFIADVLAPKYGSIYMILQQDTTAWQVANLELVAGASWNPYKYEDATVAGYVETIHHGDEAAALTAAKALNKYVVEQAWFAPWYRMQSSFVTNANTTVDLQTDNAYPYLWNFTPKS
jgi:peptide/nickel transport system substrate-binding protein